MRNNAIVVLVTVLMVMALTMTARAQETAQNVSEDDGRIALDAEMCRTYFFVNITLVRDEGTEEDRSLAMLYDTGASSTYVDPDALERASGIRVEEGKRARIHDAVSGDVTINNFRARVNDFDHLSVMLGRPIDGILAHDFFEGFLTVLDYPAEEAYLEKGELPRPDDKRIFNTRGEDGRPWVRMNIDGRRRRVLIDSGAANGLALNRLERYDTVSPPLAVNSSGRFDGIEMRRGARLAGDVTLGDHTMRQPILLETPGTELFGGDLLKNFVLTYDAANRRAEFARAEIQPITMKPYVSLGMFLSPEGEALKIERILPGGPAEGLDFAPGDLITGWNGVPVAQRGCIVKEDAQSLTLTRSRDGEELDVVMPLSPMVE